MKPEHLDDLFNAAVMIAVFRDANRGLPEPCVLTIKDCCDSGWRVEIDYLHHDGDIPVGIGTSETSLSNALAAAVDHAANHIAVQLSKAVPSSDKKEGPGSV